MMRATLLGAVCLAVWIATARAEVRSFEVYGIGFADPASSEEAAKTVVGAEGTVILDQPNRRLLVSTTREKHDQLADLLGKLNVPPKNVRVDVQFRSAGSSRQTDIGLRPSGSVVIKDGDVHSSIDLNPQLSHQSTRSSSDVTQTLVVMSGREARLQVGEQVPYVDWFMDYGMKWGTLHRRVNWQRVGSYLIVEPFVIGDGPQIRVKITPELSGLVDGQPYHTRFSQAATEVVVNDGDTIPLGGLGQAGDFYSHFLIGMDKSSREEQLEILLTPRMMDASNQGGSP